MLISSGLRIPQTRLVYIQAMKQNPSYCQINLMVRVSLKSNKEINMEYYEDYESHAAVYEDEISGCTWTQQDLDDCELKSEILIDEIIKGE